MQWIEMVKAVILGIIQGITEWLPISSTGHMILADQFLKLAGSENFVNVFMVVIQFGSILAVVTLYFHKLNPFSPKKDKQQKSDTWQMWFKVLVACVPAAIIGIVFGDQIHKYLYNAPVVAAALIVYGVLFIILENRHKKPKMKSISNLTYKTALMIGVFQVLALVPGTSRSGSTILGAVLLGASRGMAAEFSFFLAVPVMFGASLVELLKEGLAFTGAEWGILIMGMVVAYVVSIFAIKFLMNYIRKHDFKAFGYYRIILGIIVILYFAVSGAAVIG
jgi:undecaprenyl-diphosphatase